MAYWHYINQSKKFQQFTKLCKGNISQNSKTAKRSWGDIIACWIPAWPLQD